jgi:hypothetical protein
MNPSNTGHGRQNPSVNSKKKPDSETTKLVSIELFGSSLLSSFAQISLLSSFAQIYMEIYLSP